MTYFVTLEKKDPENIIISSRFAPTISSSLARPHASSGNDRGPIFLVSGILNAVRQGARWLYLTISALYLSSNSLFCTIQ